MIRALLPDGTCLFLVDDVVFLFWIYQNAGLDQNRSLAMLRFKSVLCLRKWFLWEENLGHDCRHVGNIFVGEDLGCFAEVCQVLPPTRLAAWFFGGAWDNRVHGSVELGHFPVSDNFLCVGDFSRRARSSPARRTVFRGFPICRGSWPFPRGRKKFRRSRSLF